MPRATLGDRLSIEDLRAIDSACDRFETAWRSGPRPDIADFLEDDSGLPPAVLFRELLALDRELRLATAERPEPGDYAGRFPEFVAEIDGVFGIGGATDLSPMRPPAIPGDSHPTLFGPKLARVGLGPSALESLRSSGYEVLGELGRGGMGVVYLARKVALGRLCALKMIQAGAHASPSALARFRTEASAVARLRHPGIVQIYHVGEADGLPYLELEYIPGGNLDAASDGPRPAREAAELVAIVARSIAEAHRRGIIHRDLKPANILLELDGHPKVADFGLAKSLDSDDGLTKTHAVFGSPSYMAPEQAEGHSRLVGPATDVYALGAILYELLTGHPPFRAATAMETLALVTGTDPVPPSRLQPGLARDVETICLKCLEKSPSRRYPSAEALADDLGRYLAGEPILARPASAWEKARKWSRRRPTASASLAIAGAAIVMLIGGALLYGARLRTAVKEAEAARKDAVAQTNLVLSALDELIYGEREDLRDTPAMRPLRRRQLTAALEILNRVASGAETSAPDLSRAVAHQKLGDIFRQGGRPDEAHHQYELARVLGERLASRTRSDPAIDDCLRETYYGLGALRLRAGKTAEAVVDFRRVVVLCERMLAAQPDRAEVRRAALEADLQLGRALSFDAKLQDAETCFARMRDRAEAWSSEDPDDRTTADFLSSAYRKLADVRKLTGHPAESREDYLRAIEIGRKIIAAEPTNMTYKGHLAIALHDLAGVAFSAGVSAEARLLFREAEGLFSERAAADPDDMDTAYRLLHAQYDLGVLERGQHRYEEAASAFRRAVGRLRRLEQDGRLPKHSSYAWLRIDAMEREVASCSAPTIGQ